MVAASRFRATSAASNRSDGTRFTRLPSTPGGDGDPDWSPNGTGIAFVTSRFTPEQGDIAAMAPDGTHVTRISGISPSRALRCRRLGRDRDRERVRPW
jgi:Tol biopolymer transport system component